MRDYISKILSDTALSGPDGRSLHGYTCSQETFTNLEKMLTRDLAARVINKDVAAGFVFWAAEHIRAKFLGGQLAWSFIFDELGLHDDQELGRNLVEQGLGWWGRKVRISVAHHRMFLYSLMAEGGIPEALLSESGLYRRVLMGLLAEIEAEGRIASDPWVEQISMRWVERLPHTFQTPDFARLLADLALSLADLRAVLPKDLPESAAVPWLKKHKPSWASSIPLRMTAEIAETLIHPALRAERDSLSSTSAPLSTRELRRDVTGTWHGYLNLNDNGWLAEETFGEAKNLKLRLLPVGANLAKAPTYSGIPEQGGWRCRRFGCTGRVQIPFPPHEPFALAAYADSRTQGEAVIDPGIPDPDVEPSLWRSTSQVDTVESDRLVPLSGSGRTRANYLWLLVPRGVEPSAGIGLELSEPELAPDGSLWKISGRGEIFVGEKRYLIQTQAEEEMPEARIVPYGKLLYGWRLDGKVPIYHGDVTICGQLGASRLRRIPSRELRRMPGRLLFSEIVEWERKNETLVRIQLIRLDETIRFNLLEDAQGRVTLKVNGLKDGWHVTLRAEEQQANGVIKNGNVALTLETPRTSPGLVFLRLADPERGAALELQTVWPARKGVVLNQEGIRLTQNEPLSVDALDGWRAVVPRGGCGDFQLQISSQRPIALPVMGEVSLATHLPLIKAMLAQGTPDAQVNLCLVVGGNESRRLEIRRYHDQAIVRDEILHAGLDRNESDVTRISLGDQLGINRGLELYAVYMDKPEQVQQIKGTTPFNLNRLPKDMKGDWLIQSRLSGRTQRAAVWSQRGSFQRSRDERIKVYVVEWQRLISAPDDSGWDRLWQLIKAVGQGGDAGVLDQVQALAQVPEAAISLALRVPPKDIPVVQVLDSVAPIFWPVLPVTAFTDAVKMEYGRCIRKFQSFFDESVAIEEANSALAKRIGEILVLQPELSRHYGEALVKAELIGKFMTIPEHQEALQSLLLPNPPALLERSIGEAAQRFERLPDGVRCPELYRRPIEAKFNYQLQQVIDAPFVAAEAAANRRPVLNTGEILSLINLRLTDSLYFDTALPAALNFYL